ncbi:MAG: Gfo/Idh/MocA family oxidoreductase [Oscillospiraceae bacterium]
MKILFSGLGSIGSRHIKNLSEELSGRGIAFSIDALRLTDRPLRGGVEELLNHCFSDMDALGEYDIAFVTNPTCMHEETVKKLADKARDMFIEKPVFSTSFVDVKSLGLRADGVYYVACPLRHTPVIREMKRICEREHVVAARALCSSYLPEWRAGTDYRECYSAHKAQGGGVVLDLIHEWDYLTYLFGMPSSVSGYCGKLSALEIDSEDVAVYAARFKSMLLTLQLDYIGRTPQREIEIFTDDEVIVGDILANSVARKKTGETTQLAREDFYANEMRYFVDCVLERKTDNMNDIKTALGVLRAAQID